MVDLSAANLKSQIAVLVFCGVSNLFSDKIKLGTAAMQVVKVCDVLLALAKLKS